MRSLISGIVAAVVAATVWMTLEHVTQQELSWFTVVVGLITGCGVRIAAGAHSGESYVRGALATVLTLLAIVGGRQCYSKVMERYTNAPVPVAQASSDSSGAKADKAEDGASPTDIAQDTDLISEYGDVGPTRQPGKLMSTSDAAKELSTLDIIFLCVASLCAYVVGKGGGKLAVESEEANTENREAEPSDAASEAEAE